MHHIVTECLTDDEIALIVDADTCCLKPIQISDEVESRVRAGALAAAPDIVQRYTSAPKDWWHVPAEKQLVYFNYGVLMVGAAGRPIIEKCLSFASDSRFHSGPFCDQTILNHVMPACFSDRFCLLDNSLNWMHRENAQTIIRHFAGGAGKYGTCGNRHLAHRAKCEEMCQGSFR